MYKNHKAKKEFLEFQIDQAEFQTAIITDLSTMYRLVGSNADMITNSMEHTSAVQLKQMAMQEEQAVLAAKYSYKIVRA